MKDESDPENVTLAEDANPLRFLTIDQWVGTDQLISIWNDSVQHFSPLGELQQLILQRPISGGPILVEATASRGVIPPKPFPALQGNVGISAMWLAGHKGTDTRTRLLLLAWEHPIESLVLDGCRIDQSTIERLHFERFRTDELLAFGEMPYSGRILQDDRPDLVIEMDQIRVGIDCCQFMDQEAKVVHSLFNTLKAELKKQGPDAFSAIHGSTITLLFGYPTGLGLPPKRSGVMRIAQELASALADFIPEFPEVNSESGPFPDQIKLDMRTSSSGIKFYAQRWLPATHSKFFEEMGFDLTFAYTMERMISDGWNVVRKLIKDHDTDGFDHLLVSIGAPDKDGMIFSGESAWFQEMLRFPEVIERPQHLSRVIFHNWSNGLVHDLVWSGEPSVTVRQRHGPVRHG